MDPLHAKGSNPVAQSKPNEGMTVIELEFDTGSRGSALLGDMAASLVSLDDLLRDLASMTADPSSAEFRQVEIAAIDLRSPLRITLSLIGIPPGAVNAFQEICRGVILSRERKDLGARHLPNIQAAVALCTPDGAAPQHHRTGSTTPAGSYHPLAERRDFVEAR